MSVVTVCAAVSTDASDSRRWTAPVCPRIRAIGVAGGERARDEHGAVDQLDRRFQLREVDALARLGVQGEDRLEAGDPAAGDDDPMRSGGHGPQRYPQRLRGSR